MHGIEFLLLAIFTNISVILSQQSIEPAISSTVPPGIFDENEHSPSEVPDTQLQPFVQLAHGLRSGPIIIVDTKTFYISNLHYDGKGPDAHFWVGNGTEPQSNGILVFNEKGTNESLSAYNGENVYIRLPGNLTIDQIGYLSMWCIKHQHNFGHTIVPKGIIANEPEMASNPQYAGTRKIVRLQRCCSERRTLRNKLCVVKNDTFGDARRSHKPYQFLQDSSVDFFVNYIKCGKNRQFLQLTDDEFVIHENTSIVYTKTGKLLSQDDYCIDSDFRNGADDSALICVDVDSNSSSRLFVTGYKLVITMMYVILINN